MATGTHLPLAPRPQIEEPFTREEVNNVSYNMHHYYIDIVVEIRIVLKLKML